MLSAKVTSVFNADFSFDTESAAPSTHFKDASYKSTTKATEEENDIGEVIESDNHIEADQELDSDNESKEELEKLINNKDHVRLKSQKSKVKFK